MCSRYSVLDHKPFNHHLTQFIEHSRNGSTISMILSGTDIEGIAGAFIIKSLPTDGVLKDTNGNTLTTGSMIFASTNNQVTVFFTPDANFNGTTSFTYAASDNNGLQDATPATATITVNAINNSTTIAPAAEQLTSAEQTVFPNFTTTDTDLQSIQNTNGIWIVY